MGGEQTLEHLGDTLVGGSWDYTLPQHMEEDPGFGDHDKNTWVFLGTVAVQPRKCTT